MIFCCFQSRSAVGVAAATEALAPDVVPATHRVCVYSKGESERSRVSVTTRAAARLGAQVESKVDSECSYGLTTALRHDLA